MNSIERILNGENIRSVILEDAMDDWLASQSDYATFDAKDFLNDNPELKKTITPRLIDAINRGLEMLKMPARMKCTVGNYRNDYYGDHEDNYFASVTGGSRAENLKAIEALKLLFKKCGITIHDEHEKGNAVRFLFDPIGSAVTEGIDSVVYDMAHDDFDNGHPFEDYHDFADYLNDLGYDATRELFDLYLKIYAECEQGER